MNIAYFDREGRRLRPRIDGLSLLFTLGRWGGFHWEHVRLDGVFVCRLCVGFVSIHLFTRDAELMISAGARRAEFLEAQHLDLVRTLETRYPDVFNDLFETVPTEGQASE